MRAFSPFRFLLLAALVLIPVIPAQAGNNDIVLNPALVQNQFDAFVEEVGTALAYNPVGPAEPLGLLGFDLGVSVTATDVDSSLWDLVVADGSGPSTLVIPRIQARKGLPFGIDVGLSYVAIPDSSISVIGGEIRKALLGGNTLFPAVSVSGHYTTLQGVSQLDLTTYGVDVGISKGVLMFTPYAGIGQVWIDASENNSTITLADANESVTRGYVGVKFAFLPILNMVAQADFSTAVNSVTLRLNVGL